jgi:hypothetical protein
LTDLTDLVEHDWNQKQYFFCDCVVIVYVLHSVCADSGSLDSSGVGARVRGGTGANRRQEVVPTYNSSLTLRTSSETTYNS